MTPEAWQQTSVETERRGRIPILISGLPGRMATLVAEAIEQHGDFELLPLAMTSVNHHQEAKQVGERRLVLLTAQAPFHRWPINGLPSGTIAVDFTRTNSVVENARNYVESNIPFVMGTSVGFHRIGIEALVRNSQISAVTAPTMATRVSEVQAVEETLMAICFLDRQMRDGIRGQVFTRADVLHAQRSQGGEAR